MKYATLLLGLVPASIATARAEMLNCNGTIVEPIYVPTCPASVPLHECLSVRFDGYKITNAPLTGIELRLKTKTPRRGISTMGPELIEATLNGKRCQLPE
jgi:hypothetical protein